MSGVRVMSQHAAVLLVVSVTLDSCLSGLVLAFVFCLLIGIGKQLLKAELADPGTR